MSDAAAPCPCGSGRTLAECCGRWLNGAAVPARAEQLMRSRYTAFVLGDSDYLLRTWHPSTRPVQLSLETGVRWFGLRILACEAGGAADDQGRVEFVAQFHGRDRLQYLHERSRFVREEGRWYYLDGDILAQPQAPKLGRNDPCPCGSGKKYKRCCG